MADTEVADEVMGEEVAEGEPGEPMDIFTALREHVLKKALAHGGLARGINECVKAIEKGQAQLCVLAQDCDQPDYTKLIEALCKEHNNLNTITVPSGKDLGMWSGLCKIDNSGIPRKVVRCSCVVVTDYGEETEGLNILTEFLKNRA
mmetsp:Transcript_2630/g.2941  ORF Transcript_2630/g.2941 Transcript_2630/m.2941 type:complete len:147 (-) Transcript_2630:105-545(-)|eukprot:CAMPEP_0197843510 /NCGR_PEP_ID=MMETSP1438-20131217/389_1 /TAXON_ID=1461541 /ORGANISM="Pterosperma sp., Strain CCMP1384" /LENGTH=146 /DNA_ID=CAMNT_0043453697 /DNA_START=113 /DNA_END=553 /DNA_ORIENTATION=+